MRFFLALAVLLMSTTCFADVYVIVKPDKSVYSVSPEDDAVVPEGYDKIVLEGKYIEDFNLNNDITLYDFKNNNFQINSKRALKKQQDEVKEAARIEKVKEDAVSAKNKLKQLGLTDEEIKALTSQ